MYLLILSLLHVWSYVCDFHATLLLINLDGLFLWLQSFQSSWRLIVSNDAPALHLWLNFWVHNFNFIDGCLVDHHGHVIIRMRVARVAVHESVCLRSLFSRIGLLWRRSCFLDEESSLQSTLISRFWSICWQITEIVFELIWIQLQSRHLYLYVFPRVLHLRALLHYFAFLIHLLVV